MKKIILLVIVSLQIGVSANAQVNLDQYNLLVKEADSLYNVKAYRESGLKYGEAFASIGGKGSPTDRYNAACAWALASVTDSAFFQLERIATKSNYTDYTHTVNDPDLLSLHADPRWEKIIVIIKANKDKAEANLNKPLVAMLDSIYADDQLYRQQLSVIEKKYGRQSQEMKAQWEIIEQKDAANLIKVKSILDKYGWLGADEIGGRGNNTLFLVIQHADLATQEKYLPMMRDAVNKGKAMAASLALLEDRVALGKGKKQIYGSQIGQDQTTGKHYVLPLEDPDNVDKRRASVGLGSLAAYVSYWDIIWDVEQYKKDISALEKKSNK